MATDTTHEFPDELYKTQAAYVAGNTHLTAKEAEAYLRRAHTDHPDTDTKTQHKTLAKQMGITESTFSNHINTAYNKIQGETGIKHALTTLLHTTDYGGPGGISRQVTATKNTANGYILFTETEFYNEEHYTFPAKYRAHFVYRDPANEVINEDVPDTVLSHTKYSILTIDANTETHFAESTIATINAINAFNEYDTVAAANLLEETYDILIDELNDKTSAVVQDASNIVMEHSTP